jgi:hypothetical protein
MIIEKAIQDAVVTRIEARAYIIAQSIPVRGFDDRTTADGITAVVVRCRPANRINIAANYYEMLLEVIAISYLEADIKGDSLSAVYQECMSELNTDMTVTALNTSIGDAHIAINGIIPIIGDDEGDEFGLQKAQANIYLTYTQTP